MKLEAVILSKLTQEQKNQTPHVLTHKWKYKVAVLHKENCRFNTISVKLPMAFFTELEKKTILKLTCNQKRA